MNVPADHIARYFKKNENNTLTCQLCPRNCNLAPQQKGFCFVRENISGKLILTTYGRIEGLHADPIEKKPLYHFLPGTKTLSFGTIGCNLSCPFCQNWSLSRATNFSSNKFLPPESIAKLAKDSNCDSIAFTYNEPIIFLEYAVDVAKECRKLDIKTVAVTAGYISSLAREEFFSHMDAVNIDLKSFSNNYYTQTLRGNLKTVLDNINYVHHETNAWLEITNLLIPEINDSADELEQLINWILHNLGDSVPLHFSAFHPANQMITTPATQKHTLCKAREIALSSNMKYVYTGNISDSEGSTTYCHKCKTSLIIRDHFEIINKSLIKNNICPECNTPCSGVF